MTDRQPFLEQCKIRASALNKMKKYTDFAAEYDKECLGLLVSKEGIKEYIVDDVIVIEKFESASGSELTISTADLGQEVDKAYKNGYTIAGMWQGHYHNGLFFSPRDVDLQEYLTGGVFDSKVRPRYFSVVERNQVRLNLDDIKIEGHKPVQPAINTVIAILEQHTDKGDGSLPPTQSIGMYLMQDIFKITFSYSIVMNSVSNGAKCQVANMVFVENGCPVNKYHGPRDIGMSVIDDNAQVDEGELARDIEKGFRRFRGGFRHGSYPIDRAVERRVRERNYGGALSLLQDMNGESRELSLNKVSDTMYREIKTLMDAGNAPDALSVIDRALGDTPDSDHIRLRVGPLMLEKDYFGAAINHYSLIKDDSIKRRFKDSITEALKSKTDRCIRMKDYDATTRFMATLIASCKSDDIRDIIGNNIARITAVVSDENRKVKEVVAARGAEIERTLNERYADESRRMADDIRTSVQLEYDNLLKGKIAEKEEDFKQKSIVVLNEIKADYDKKVDQRSEQIRGEVETKYGEELAKKTKELENEFATKKEEAEKEFERQKAEMQKNFEERLRAETHAESPSGRVIAAKPKIKKLLENPIYSSVINEFDGLPDCPEKEELAGDVANYLRGLAGKAVGVDSINILDAGYYHSKSDKLRQLLKDDVTNYRIAYINEKLNGKSKKCIFEAATQVDNIPYDDKKTEMQKHINERAKAFIEENTETTIGKADAFSKFAEAAPSAELKIFLSKEAVEYLKFYEECLDWYKEKNARNIRLTAGRAQFNDIFSAVIEKTPTDTTKAIEEMLKQKDIRDLCFMYETLLGGKAAHLYADKRRKEVLNALKDQILKEHGKYQHMSKYERWAKKRSITKEQRERMLASKEAGAT